MRKFAKIDREKLSKKLPRRIFRRESGYVKKENVFSSWRLSRQKLNSFAKAWI